MIGVLKFSPIIIGKLSTGSHDINFYVIFSFVEKVYR